MARTTLWHETFQLTAMAVGAWFLSGLALAAVVTQDAPGRLGPTQSQMRLAAQLVVGQSAQPPKPAPAPALAADTYASDVAARRPQGDASPVYLPVLFYHHLPADFDQQLTYLDQHGYHVVDLDTAVHGLAGGPLPSRPVVITFDDGFADQMDAVPILRAHGMKATFYIINGGAATQWCIGSGRRYGDPLQPPQGCGDAYLTWDQVREMDATGVANIAGHTLNHPNLPALSAEEQFHEIADSKAQIEAQIGHTIHHFAYPYGAFDAVTVDAVRRAGYASAVSTIAGSEQNFDNRFELRRLRTAFDLPE